MAVSGGWMEMVQLFLKTGASPEEAAVRSNRYRDLDLLHGMTALDLAIEHGHDKVVIQLIKSGVNLTARPYLDRAIRKGRDLVVQSIREDASPDIILPELSVFEEMGAKVVRDSQHGTIKLP